MPDPTDKYALTKTLVPVVGSPGLFQEVRKFSDANIQALVERAVAGLPASQKSARVIVEFTPEGGFTLAGALKLSNIWSVQGAFRIKSPEDWAVGAGIDITWE